MRADPAEVKFREWLLNIGNAINARGNRAASPLLLQEGQLANSLDELISYCFPRQFFFDPFKYHCNVFYFFALFHFYFQPLFAKLPFFAH
jgi:hypothetical protein